MKRLFYISSVVILLAVTMGLFCTGSAVAMQQVEVKPTADDLPIAADFGRSVAIAGDLVAVGAGADNAGSVSNAGAVYLYKRQGLTYVPEAKLTAPGATTGAEFEQHH